jgi:ABC-type transport system substrate-binding protein
METSLATNITIKKFIIPNGILPNSTDPLHIDQFNNYFPGQMLYTTPLTVTEEGDLTSLVLKSFTYDKTTKKITFVVKDNIQYSDGSKISPEDIAFSISRMLHSRPDFPVIRFIKGKDIWLSQDFPLKSLPDGIKISQNTISIELTKNVLNPLYRFTMNIMSIIPRNCVNLETNKIICKQIPSSGHYLEKERNESSVTFERRKDTILNDKIPELISFQYPTTKSTLDLANKIDQDSVIFAYDLDFSQEEYNQLLENFSTKRLAPAWFSGIVINPRLKPFNDENCRKVLLNSIHQNLSGQNISPRIYSKSIFTKLIPGYLKNEELRPFEISNDDIKSCIEKFKDQKFKWGIRRKIAPAFLVDALKKTAKDLNLQLDIENPEIAPGSHTGWDAYQNKNVVLHTTHSGFWPLDPIGDIQMLFTPNMHQDYKDIWTNNQLVTLLKDLGDTEDESLVDKKMKIINQSLYQDATMSIISHQSYTYIYKKSKAHIKNLSLTVPYPWEVF